MTDEPQQHGDGDHTGDGTTSRKQEAGTSRRDEGNERKESRERQAAARRTAEDEPGGRAGAVPGGTEPGAKPGAGASRAAKPVPGAKPDASKAEGAGAPKPDAAASEQATGPVKVTGDSKGTGAAKATGPAKATDASRSAVAAPGSEPAAGAKATPGIKADAKAASADAKTAPNAKTAPGDKPPASDKPTPGGTPTPGDKPAQPSPTDPPKEIPAERTTQLRVPGAKGSGRPGKAGKGTPAKAGPTAPVPAGPPGTPPPPGDTGTAAMAADDGDGPEQPKKKGRKSRKRKGWRRLFPTWRMTLGGLVLLILLLGGAFAVGYATTDIPEGNQDAQLQSNVYYYADGTLLARDGTVNRVNVKLSEIPKSVQRTVLAAEDRDFYSESAVDPAAMVRAAWNTATGKGKQSGSTITQQYVKNYYLDQDQTVTRKAKEFFISLKLDREKSKDEILEGYLNTSYFGRNAYGIQAAARAYYDKDVGQLTVPEGAYLASLLNAPSAYDVVVYPENKRAAEARWSYVLDGMVKQHWMTAADRAKAKFPTPKEPTSTNSSLSGQRGYLVEAVKNYLAENGIDKNHLTNQGYRITTTFKKSNQDALVKAVNDQLIDKLDKKNRPADRNVRAGAASIDPKTGQVVAMYGGIDWVKQFTNNATRADFQVGSTFKPFVFTSALENHSTTQDGETIMPATMYDGTSKRPVKGSSIPFSPENEDERDYGRIPVSVATDKSVNSVYAQMAVDVGPAKVKKTAEALGLAKGTPSLAPYPSIALGTATPSVLRMTEAYATLANHGKHNSAQLVVKITDRDGKRVELPGHHSTQAVRRTAADTTTSILQSVVEKGTAMAARGASRPAAGKTGTAEEDTAALFAGYTPDLATVVSVMGQDPKTAKHVPLYGALGVARMNGGGPPTEIWSQYVKQALKGKKAHDFDLKLAKGAKRKPPVSQAPSSSNSPSTGTSPSNPTSSTPSDDGQNGTGEQNGTGATGSTPPGGTVTPPGGGEPTGGATDPGGGDPGTGPGGTDPGGDAGGTGPGGAGDPGGQDGDPGGGGEQPGGGTPGGILGGG
ncbi:transglycosylase domain-containing protein [Streptomyces sp. SPB78]|uniref:transglycosylase domain-containing protein n=1 Tax=Streptomyces sp. (strain SPB78) TaxID=591157 RepID=UPI0001B57405|nr:transglycosylase domain-containing protein [Streptomyces sp. SPB78]